MDFRKSSEPLPWDEIKFAQVKRLSINPGLKILLEDGSTHDVDFHLLNGRADQAFLAMREYLYREPDEDGEEDEDEEDEDREGPARGA